MHRSGDGFPFNPFTSAADTQQENERSSVLLSGGKVAKDGKSERFQTDRFTLTATPPLSSNEGGRHVLHQQDLLKLDLSLEGITGSCHVKARIVGESEVARVETHRFLSTNLTSFLSPSTSTNTSEKTWETLLPSFPSCTCSLARNTPLPNTSRGAVDWRVWEVKYFVEVVLYEEEDKKGWGRKGKGKARQPKETSYLIPFTFEFEPDISRWYANRRGVVHVVRDFDYESSDPNDLTIKSMELRHELLLTSTSDNDSSSSSSPPPYRSSPTLSYSLLISFGTRHHPSVSRFLSLLSHPSTEPTLSLSMEQCCVVEEFDPVRPLEPRKREGRTVVLLRSRGGEEEGDQEEGQQVVENRIGEVRCDVALARPKRPAERNLERRLSDPALFDHIRLEPEIDPVGLRDTSAGILTPLGYERAEEVLVEFKGEVELVGTKGPEKKSWDEEKREGSESTEAGEKGERVETCKIKTRYDLKAIVTFPSPHKPLVLTSSDIRIDLAPPPAALPPSGSSLADFVPSPSQRDDAAVAVDAERYPALAALYSGTRIISSSASSAAPSAQSVTGASSGREEQLPVYEPPPSSVVTASDEKTPSRLSSSPPASSSRTVEPAPPAYPATSASNPALDRPPASPANASPSSPLPPSNPPSPTGPAEPPTWEEAVRDDMIDDWVAANAVLGDEEQAARGQSVVVL